jgi:acyl-CoA dehydrogenase
VSAVAALAGGVFDCGTDGGDDVAELRRLVGDIGRRSFDARLGHRTLPEEFDDVLWHNLEETGLSRLTSTPDLGAGPTELAIVLYGLARHAAAVPIAETDLLAAWLAAEAGLDVPGDGPLTVAIADADVVHGRIAGTATDVPWAESCVAVLLAVRMPNSLRVSIVRPAITDGHNLAGEPRGSFDFDLAADCFETLDAATGDELIRRGAWARCVQIIGAIDAAAELSVAHTRDRVQFGRSLSKFQAVQHSLASMAGEIERARAAATLAVAAAADHGFDSPEAAYAVTVAKVTLGRVVGQVTTIAHQLHGAIGVTIEHPLRLATMRAKSWADEFGSTGHYARLLGRVVLARGQLDAVDPWDVLIGNELRSWG